MSGRSVGWVLIFQIIQCVEKYPKIRFCSEIFNEIWKNWKILNLYNYDIVSKHQNFGKIWENLGKFGKIWKNLGKIATLNVKSNSKNLLHSKVFHFRP